MSRLDEIMAGTNPRQRFIVLKSLTECPEPPDACARERRCQGCGVGVWIAPSTIQFLISRMGENWVLMCNACADPFVEADPRPTFIVPSSPHNAEFHVFTPNDPRR